MRSASCCARSPLAHARTDEKTVLTTRVQLAAPLGVSCTRSSKIEKSASESPAPASSPSAQPRSMRSESSEPLDSPPSRKPSVLSGFSSRRCSTPGSGHCSVTSCSCFTGRTTYASGSAPSAYGRGASDQSGRRTPSRRGTAENLDAAHPCSVSRSCLPETVSVMSGAE